MCYSIQELFYRPTLRILVHNINGINMFLGHDWLVKHNPEVNWKNRTIQFTRCPGSCKIKHQDIEFKTRRIQTTENKEQDNRKIGKEPDATNLEDLPDYI